MGTVMCKSSVACAAIQNVFPEEKFFEMVHNNEPVFWTFFVCLLYKAFNGTVPYYAVHQWIT